MRWFVATIMYNFRLAPWHYVVMAAAALSMVIESGIISGFSKQKYLRQKRAYMLVATALALFVAFAVFLSLIPGNILLSAFGTFSNSALQRGLFPIIAFVLYLLSIIYAYSIGRFNAISDVVKATVSLPVRIADYFITMFVTSQLLAMILHAFFIDFIPGQKWPIPVVILAILLYGIPLVLHCVIAINNHE